MDNSARMARVTALVADVHSCQLDALSHQENFKSISDQAYGALQDYLKSKGMTTTDELVKDVIKTLPPDEQQKILDRLKELTPKTGFEYFLQPSELAKILFSFPLISGATTYSAPYYYQAKAWYTATRSQAVLDATRSGKALTEEGKAIASLNQAQRQALLDDLQAERAALADEYLDLELGMKFKDIAGIEMTEADATAVTGAIDKAVAAVKNIEQIEGEALAAAGKITWWTKANILIGVAAIIGLMIYDHIKEGEIKDELHETIAKVATARLYARMAERMELTHTDQMSTISMLIEAIKDGDKGTQEFLQKNFAKTISKACVGITEDSTFAMLEKSDKDNHADTREDPDLTEIKKRGAANSMKPLP